MVACHTNIARAFMSSWESTSFSNKVAATLCLHVDPNIAQYFGVNIDLSIPPTSAAWLTELFQWINHCSRLKYLHSLVPPWCRIWWLMFLLPLHRRWEPPSVWDSSRASDKALDSRFSGDLALANTAVHRLQTLPWSKSWRNKILLPSYAKPAYETAPVPGPWLMSSSQLAHVMVHLMLDHLNPQLFEPSFVDICSLLHHNETFQQTGGALCRMSWTGKGNEDIESLHMDDWPTHV